MDKIFKIHSQAMVSMIATPIMIILLAMFCANYLNLLFPAELIAMVSISPVFISSIRRLKVWLNRESILTEEELNSPTVKVFFAIIPIEMLFPLFALGFIFGE